MASHSKGKSSRHILVESQGLTSWRGSSSNGPSLIISLVNEAAHSPIAELKQAASITITILRNIKVVKEDKEAYARLGDDASGLIVVIWNSYKKTEFPNEWLSAEMREILEDLTHTLENICSFVQERISKKKGLRMILGRSDAGKKISEYREHLNYAMQKFELQSQMNINDILMQIMRKNDQISEQILHRNEEEELNHALEIIARDARDQELAEKMQAEELEISKEILKLEHLNQVEIDRHVEEGRSHSENLKKIEKEKKGRKSELERLRAAASAMEEANRLKKAEEEEIAQLKRTLAAEEANRRSSAIQAQSSKKHESSKEEDEIDEAQEDREVDFIVEEATSEEEEDRPVRKSSKVKRNCSGSPKRRPRVVENSTDDEEDLQHLKSSKKRTARRKPSSTSLGETEDEYTDDEDRMPRPSRKSRKANHRPQSLPRSPPLDVNDLMDRIKDFTPLGCNLYGSQSDTHISSPMYGPLVSAPSWPYGYLPGTIVNSGIGNITNATIANVGNDNSVRNIYRK